MSLWQHEADTFDTETEEVIVETKEEEVVVQVQEPAPTKRLIPEVRASRRRESTPKRGTKAAGRIRP